MSIRAVNFANDEYYHLYNRGNSKMEIYHDEQDYLYFKNLLLIMNMEQRFKTRFVSDERIKGDSLVSIGAYCLMPNHFHILVRQEKENGISLFMQKVSTAYVMYYNKKYKRTGSLFEGKFKSKYAGIDTYLKYLFSYIHLNPLKIIEPDWKTKIKFAGDFRGYDFIARYPYSSAGEYLASNYEIVERFSFPDYFPTKIDFKNDLFSWFNLNQTDTK
jgi:putative transposase